MDYLKNLINIVDYVAMMDYVDDETRIINDAQDEINYVNTFPGKKVIIGVETKDWILRLQVLTKKAGGTWKVCCME